MTSAASVPPVSDSLIVTFCLPASAATLFVCSAVARCGVVAVAPYSGSLCPRGSLDPLPNMNTYSLGPSTIVVMFEMVPYPLACERLVRKTSDVVKMDMGDGLSRSLSDVPSYVVTLGAILIDEQLNSVEKVESLATRLVSNRRPSPRVGRE